MAMGVVTYFSMLTFFWALAPAEARRIVATLKGETADDLLDLSPLFLQNIPLDDPQDSSASEYWSNGRTYRCCCKDGQCSIGDLSLPNSCDAINVVRDRNRCGCLVGVGFSSFDSEDQQSCLIPASIAATVLFSFDLQLASPDEVRAEVAQAAKTKQIGSKGKGNGFKITYGECSTSCGDGTRDMLEVTNSKGEVLWDLLGTGELPAVVDGISAQIECKETAGCEYNCFHDPVNAECGWGKLTCLDSHGREGALCDLRGTLEENFPRQSDAELDCFKPCPAGRGISSFCAITSNHLDEQYGDLAMLAGKTCLVDQAPDMIVLLTQELNHVGLSPFGQNDFPKYVYNGAIEGYTLAATCEGHLSANTAVFVRTGQEHHIFSQDVECTGTTLVSSPCDWTNCKGSTVMGLSTSAGKLVVGNWHGARSGTLSEKRVREFEDAARAVLDIQPFQGKKYVVFGGDTNVRSDFGSKGTYPEGLDLAEVQTPAAIVSALGPDVLGVGGWTVDQHLSGTVGFDEAVKAGLREFPLKQVKGWNTMCMGKTKVPDPAWYKTVKVPTGEYTSSWLGKKEVTRKEKKTFHNLKCRSPPDQMSDGHDPEEYIDMKKIWGDKSSAPSWTERFFLDPTLYDNCGKAMKDVRNARSDHDPVYVHCTLPDL